MTIYASLLTKLKSITGVPEHADLGKIYKPTANKPWCRARNFTGESAPLNLGADGTNLANGTFQIDLFRPMGMGDDSVLAERIKDAFNDLPDDLEADGKRLFIDKAWLGPVREEEAAWLKTIVFVKWYSEE